MRGLNRSVRFARACVKTPRSNDLPAPRRRKAEHGAALVELAVVMPILLLVVTGICTFGIAFNNYLTLTEATSVGARQLAISPGVADPCNTAATAVYSAAPLLTQSKLVFSLAISNNGTAVGTYSGTTCTGASQNLDPGYTAQLTVTYPCSLSVYGVNYAPSCSLKAQIAELVQ